MNNFEKIKAMTLDEMAKWIDGATNDGEYTCSYCAFFGNCNDDCLNGVKQWLESESEE